MPYADDKAETAGAGCRHARCCVLENYGARWKDAETASGFQEHIRSRFPGEAQVVKIDAIDAYIEECRREIPARRISAQWRLDEATAVRMPRPPAPRRRPRPGRTPARPRVQKLQEIAIFALSKSMEQFLFRLSPRVPPWAH